MEKDNIIIIGSGISGLLAAYFLALKHKSADVYVVEKNKEAGGLLRRYYYGEEFGSFDYGMHNILETGEKELDDFVFSLLPAHEWQLLDGKKRDLAGIYFNNKLQYNTPYFDVRNFAPVDREQCISSFFAHINNTPVSNREIDRLKNAEQFARDRFGSFIASRTIIPSVEKIHQKKAEDLDYMATVFTPMSRIAMFDESLMNDLIKSDVLREYIAFPEQRNLPLERSSGRKAMYPKNYGMYRVIDSLLGKLEELNVKVLTETELKSLKFGSGKVEEVKLLTSEKELCLTNVSKLVWTGAVSLLSKLLGVDISDLGFDKPLKTIVVSILLDRPLEMDDLYYFFCYQNGFHTYRLNNFTAYCDGAPRNGYYPISIELLMSETQIAELEKSLEELAIDELQKFGVLAKDTKIVFSKAEYLDSGFPMPSVKNISALNEIRSRIGKLNLSNIEIAGILAEPNLFFQTDVIRHIYLKIKENELNT